MTNTDRLNAELKIKVAYLKHRGDYNKIVSDTGYPREFVMRTCARIRKRQERDTSLLIADNIMQTILLGYESRTLRIHEMLDTLESRECLILSTCCRSPIAFGSESENMHKKYCIKCGRTTEGIVATQAEIYGIKQELIAQLREEDKAMVDFAEKMGYTQRIGSAVPILKEKPQQLQNNQQKALSGPVDVQIMEGIRQLRPMQAEKLIKRLEKKIALAKSGKPIPEDPPDEPEDPAQEPPAPQGEHTDGQA